MMMKRRAHNDEGTEVPIVQIARRRCLNGALIHDWRAAGSQLIPGDRKMHFGLLAQMVNMLMVSPRWFSVCWEADR